MTERDRRDRLLLAQQSINPELAEMQATNMRARLIEPDSRIGNMERSSAVAPCPWT